MGWSRSQLLTPGIARGGARPVCVPFLFFHHPPSRPSLAPTRSRKLHEWDATSLEGADVGAVVSFGYFLTPNVLAPLRRGALNMHPSLLPKVSRPPCSDSCCSC